ncbi:hypothetical protein [Microbulbifer discodermiae]|uniref:hypothetical protein n=1 Tax=Microbulbifer sp. 2201CG32-9 TaxID=3232309 RepID=UPI00345B9F1A
MGETRGGVMIERVHLRFQEWAAAMEGLGVGSPLGYSAWVVGSGSAEGTIPINSDVREVEQFVLKLPKDFGDTARLFYLPPYLTHDQAAKKLGVSKRTLYRRIDGIHILFYAELYRGPLPRVA